LSVLFHNNRLLLCACLAVFWIVVLCVLRWCCFWVCRFTVQQWCCIVGFVVVCFAGLLFSSGTVLLVLLCRFTVQQWCCIVGFVVVCFAGLLFSSGAVLLFLLCRFTVEAVICNLYFLHLQYWRSVMLSLDLFKHPER
jgi:hypothetical protein